MKLTSVQDDGSELNYFIINDNYDYSVFAVFNLCKIATGLI